MIHPDGSLFRLIKPGKEIQKGGLPGAARAHQSDGLPCFRTEGDAFKNRLARVVAEPDIIRFHMAFKSLNTLCVRQICNFGNLIHQFENSLRSTCSSVYSRIEPGGLADGASYVECIDDKSNQVTGCQAACQNLQAAVPEDDDQCAHKEDPHPGPEELGEYNLSAGCYKQVFDSLAVALHLIFFPYEGLHKPNGTECILCHSCRVCQIILNASGEAPDFLAEVTRGKGDHRDSQKDNQTQPPVEDHHQSNRTYQGERDCEKLRKGVGERRSDGTDIVGQPRGDFTQPAICIETKSEPVKMFIYFFTEVCYSPLPNPLQMVITEEIKKRLSDEKPEQSKGK